MYESLYGNFEESFSSRGFMKSSVFQRNDHILRILFYFCAETLLAITTNHNAITETRKKKEQHIYIYIFSFIVQVNFAYFSEIFCL